MRSGKDAINRTVRLLEDQNIALKTKVDELKNRIMSSTSSEADLKDKLSSMNRSLKETVSTSSGLQDELTRVSFSY